MSTRRAKAKTEETAPVAETAPEQSAAEAAASGPQTGAETGSTPDQNGEPQKKWADQGPKGIAMIDLGGGRRLRLIRNNSFQQVAIRIEADENIDPRPTKEDTQYLKDNGFRWRGGEEQSWTLQFFSPDDKERIAGIETEKGEQQAKLERGALRVRAMQHAEQVFITLANTIRQRNGMEPSTLSLGQGQDRTPV